MFISKIELKLIIQTPFMQVKKQNKGANAVPKANDEMDESVMDFVCVKTIWKMNHVFSR